MLAVLGGEIWDDPSEAVIEEKDCLFRLARPLSQSDYLGMIEAAAVVWAVRDRVEGMSSTVDVAMHFGRPTIVSAINVSQPGSPVGPAANGWIRQIRVRSLAESSERSMFRMSTDRRGELFWRIHEGGGRARGTTTIHAGGSSAPSSNREFDWIKCDDPCSAYRVVRPCRQIPGSGECLETFALSQSRGTVLEELIHEDHSHWRRGIHRTSSRGSTS